MTEPSNRPVSYEGLKSMSSLGDTSAYGEAETLLYNLGVGFGRDPMDEDELAFVYEAKLRAAPTMGAVLGAAQRTIIDSGLDFTRIVHGEQRLTLHRPLPTGAAIVADEQVVEVYDKGAGRGLLVLVEKQVRRRDTGELLCTNTATVFARGDGGIDAPALKPPTPHPIPNRAPDIVAQTAVRPEQAFLYALSGDRNPLHREPATARAAGFPRPILQGLATYGMACRVILAEICGYDADRIYRFDARFSAPVFPGETLTVEMWQDAPVVSYRVKVKDRDALAIDNGYCELRT